MAGRVRLEGHTRLGGKVWLYWAVIAGAYVAAEYGVQKVFVGYVGRRIERKC